MKVQLVLGVQLLAQRAAVVPVGIGPQVQVDGVQRHRTVVRVYELFQPAQHMGAVVQTHVDRVRDMLLEVRLCTYRAGQQQ
ncbi:MAG: hypothetical protein IPH53_06305 [Flavobacteriales bacterium]|nr:hypothetical protein [Flavobacteriales bacterium]